MKARFSAFAAIAALLVIASAAAFAAEPPAEGETRIQITKGDSTKVSLDVKNVPLVDVLRMLSKQFDLSVVTARNVDTLVTANLKNVSLQEALNSLVTVNGFAYRIRGSVVEVYAPKAGETLAADKPRAETFELKFARAETLKELLKPFLTKDTGKIEAEITRNTLIVFDVPDAVQTIASVIEKVDRPEAQITINAEIIETSTDITDKLGVDWQARVALTGASRPITFPFSSSRSGSNFVPDNDPTVVDGEFSPTQSFPYPAVDDFKFGTLDASGLKIVLNILKSHAGGSLIANPEITTLNNREAKINIGDTVPVPIYTTNLETGVSAVTGFQSIETGTILSVTPRVNEGGSITLTVKPEISEITGFKGQFDERPIVSSRKAETIVRVQDGETIVIGGLIKQKTDETITKLPLLGDIPVLGWLFKNKALIKTKSSLYIFITPRIVNDGNFKDRAQRAANRLKREGLHDRDTGADDIRNPGASPFDK